MPFLSLPRTQLPIEEKSLPMAYTKINPSLREYLASALQSWFSVFKEKSLTVTIVVCMQKPPWSSSDSCCHYRVVEVGRDPLEVIQTKPRACCPEPRPGGFWMSPDGDFTAPLGNLFQRLTALTVKCFLMSRWNFTCFRLCPLPHPVSGHC